MPSHCSCYSAQIQIQIQIQNFTSEISSHGKSKLECVQLYTVLSRNNCVWLLLRPIYVLPLEKGSQRLSLWFSYYDISFFLLLTFGKIVFNINVCHSSMLSHDIRTRDLLHTIYQIFQYQRLKITLNGKCKKSTLNKICKIEILLRTTKHEIFNAKIK